MAEIIEDYVSFEVAKLLKEKEFDEPCLSYYWSNAAHDFDYTEIAFTNKNLYEGQMLRPTLQMASKWLIKVHKLYVEVQPYPLDFKHEDIQDGWGCEVMHLSDLSYGSS